MEPSSNHNGNTDTVVEGLTNDARVCRNELGLVMGDSEKVADGDALVSSVANRSSDSEVKIRGELLESKNGSVTMEPCFKVSGDARVSKDELGLVVENSEKVLDESSFDANNGVNNGAGLLEAKSVGAVTERSSDSEENNDNAVHDSVGDSRGFKDELGSVVENSEKVMDKTSLALGKIGTELVESKNGTPTMEQSSDHDGGGGTVQGSVDDATVSRNEIGAVMENVGASSGVKIGDEFVESKNGTPTMEQSSDHDGGGGTVQGSVDDATVSRNEIGAVMENVGASSGVKIGDELVESKNGTPTMEQSSDHDGGGGTVQGSVDDATVSRNEIGAVMENVGASSGVKIGDELVESKNGTPTMEQSSDHDGGGGTVQGSVDDATVSRNEIGAVMENVGASSGVKIGDELVESKNGTPTMEQSSDHDGGGGTVQGSVDDTTVSRNEIGAVMENVGASSGVKIGDELVESKSGAVAMETSSEHGGKNDTVVPDIVGDTWDFKDELGSVLDDSEKVMDKTSSDAVVSSVLLGNSDISASNGVKIGAELVESKTGTPTMKQSSDHDGGGGTVQGSVDDATVSRNEIGAVMENVEKVVDESNSDALASSVPTSNGVKIGADLLDSKTTSSDHDGGGVSGDKSGIVKDENEVNVEEREGEYKVTDLVWAKVRNYPWWPGQIFDPSAATDKAKKHSNKRAFLVAYFGDQSFAWNKAPNIKHFRKNFGKMEKQNNSKAFRHAVNCALDEAYRRAEFGLACTCLSEEVVSKFKSQVFVNAGITEEASRIDGGDRFSTVANFKPVNAVMSLHDLAREDVDGVSRLEALSMKAQLLAYLRWKGYNQFSTQHLEGLDNKLEDDSEVQLMEDDKMVVDVKPASVSSKISSETIMEDDKMVEDVKPTAVSEKVSSKKRKLNARDSGSRKLQDDDDSVPIKKEKRSKNVTPKGSLSVLKKENKSEKTGGKKEKSPTNEILTKSPSALKKEKKSAKKSGTKAIVEDKGVKEESRNGTADQKATTSSPKKLFRIGDTICKIAKQLSESPTVLQNESQKSEKRTKSKNDTA